MGRRASRQQHPPKCCQLAPPGQRGGVRRSASGPEHAPRSRLSPVKKRAEWLDGVGRYPRAYEDLGVDLKEG